MKELNSAATAFCRARGESTDSARKQKIWDKTRGLNGPKFKSGRECDRCAGREGLAGLGEKDMQNGNTCWTDKPVKIEREERTAQQFEQILASGLPTLYRRANRIL